MLLLAKFVVALVAVLHLWFLVLEMFLWKKPVGRRVFRTSPEFANASATLAANQGLYNGFLVAGLLWGLALGDEGAAVMLFFLACVTVADSQCQIRDDVIVRLERGPAPWPSPTARSFHCFRVARAHPVGTRLTVHASSEEKVAGTFDGIEPDGALRLRRDGDVELIRAGDVEL